MWMESEGFMELIGSWWVSFDVQGIPDFIFASKLKLLKGKLREWNKHSFRHLHTTKSDVLSGILVLDELAENRVLSDDELL